MRRSMPILVAILVAALAWAPAYGALVVDGNGDWTTSGATAPVSGAPITMCCWALNDLDTVSDTVMSYGTSNVNNWSIQMSGDQVGNPIRLSINANFICATSTGFTVSTWHHLTLISASSTDHRSFIDGAGKGTDATSLAVTAPTTLRFGARIDNATPLAGRIANGAMWASALTDEQVLELANGAHPYTVDRANLKSYCALRGDTDLDSVAGGTLTRINQATGGDGRGIRGGFRHE